MTILDLVREHPEKSGTVTHNGKTVFYGNFEDIPLKYADKNVLEFSAPDGEILYKIEDTEKK